MTEKGKAHQLERKHINGDFFPPFETDIVPIGGSDYTNVPKRRRTAFFGTKILIGLEWEPFKTVDGFIKFLVTPKFLIGIEREE